MKGIGGRRGRGWPRRWRAAGEGGRDLSCREVGRILQTYLDGELDDTRSWLVARHLEDCRRCGLSAQAYTDIKRALRQGAGAVPPESLERLRAFGERLAEEGEPPGSEQPRGA